MGAWIDGARPRTLPAAVVPVVVGTAAVSGAIIWWRVAAAMVVSLALQIATNYVNDYADGERGTDADRVGPVRLVASGTATAGQVKRAALAAFGVAGVAGLALALAVGPELIVVGAVCMVAGWAYTGGPRPYGYHGLGEVFVFVFFGLVATIGSTYIHTETTIGGDMAVSAVAAVPVGLLAVALLVINNLRDIPTDTYSSKRTLAVRLGDRATRRFYLLLLVAVGVGIVMVAVLWRPWAAIGLVGLAAAREPAERVRSGAVGPDLIPALAGTGRAQLITGVLLAVGLALSR
jgi:1,4-dihydroxy-2-naphthoate octaprenyltransferase